MKAPGSLRLRLLLGTLAWILVTILIAGIGLASLFRQHVTHGFHTELTTQLDQLTAHLELDARNQPNLKMPLSDPRFERPLSGLYWQIDRLATTHVAQANGHDKVATPDDERSYPFPSPQPPEPVEGSKGRGGERALRDFHTKKGLLRSRSLWDQVLQPPEDALAKGQLHTHRIQGPDAKPLGLIERTINLDGQMLRLMVGADEALMAEPIARFQQQLWLALAILGLGLVLAALVQVFIGLAPLKALSQALSQVRTGQNNQLEGRFPSEVMPLVEDFNSVLQQNTEVIGRARTQAGNLAHALKTPLTIMANAAQSDGHTRLATTVLAQVEAARNQVDYHLARSRVAARRHQSAANTSIAPLVAALVRTMERLHAERHLSISTTAIPASWAFRGDAEDFQEMLGNLLDNACKWARNRVTVAVSLQGKWLILQLEDDGKGLDEQQRQAVLRRGQRADEQVPGSGLGLAIVADLAQDYGGDLQLQSASLGGLLAVLRLPALTDIGEA